MKTVSWKYLKGSAKEEALKRGFDENGGWYLRVGAQYVKTRSDVWRPMLFYGDLVFALFNLMSAGWISLVSGDMEAASETFHFTAMILNMMIITANLIYYRKLIDDLFVAIGFGFFAYGETLDPQTEEMMKNFLESMRKKKRLRFNTFVLVVWVLGASMLLKTIVAHFRFGDTVDGEGGAVSRKHIVPMWFFGIDKWPNYIFMLVVSYLGQALVMNSIWGFVLPVICFAEELTGQLHVVGMGLRRTTARAKYIYKKKYGELKNSKGHEYAECIREALKASIQHHNIILEACKGMRTLLNLPLMTVMFGTAVLLCMSGFVMVEDSVPLVPKFISILFIGGEVIYSYLFCLYGEMMKSESEDIGNQLYEDKWRDASGVFRPYLAMIRLRSNRPIKLSAGGFMEVNEAAFSSIISSSYSYFNLMFTSKT